jgi:hypothetical protein
MTHADAARRFDAMDADRKDSVVRLFEDILSSNTLPTVHDAFIAAVEDECKAIETESALRGGTMQ